MAKIRSSSSLATALLAASLFTLASPGFAASTWSNLGGSCATGNTGGNVGVSGGSYIVPLGNAFGCGTQSTVNLVADSFSTNDGSALATGTTFAKAAIYSWGSDGLGVVNAYENPATTGPHAADNLYGTDAIRLAFSSAVNLTSITIGWNGTDNGADSDLSVLAWVGPGTPGAVDGKTLTGDASSPGTLISSGWKLVGNFADVGATASNSVAVASSVFSSYWLVTAYNTSFGTVSANGGSLGMTAPADYFKLSAVSANKAPEPSSLALMAAALAGAVTLRRRKQPLDA